MKVKLADFNVGKVADPDLDVSMTRFQAVPGTLYFQSPEQETNTFELLVNATQGSPEVEFFEDFYIDIFENDTFSLFNRNELYSIAAADRTRKKLLLDRPFAESSEINVRGRGRQERRPPRRHLLARRGVLLPDLRRVREPQEPVRRVPQVHRVRTPRREQHRSPRTSSTSTARSRTCARPRPTARGAGARARGPVLQLQALPRRQRRADRSARS